MLEQQIEALMLIGVVRVSIELHLDDDGEPIRTDPTYIVDVGEQYHAGYGPTFRDAVEMAYRALVEETR